MNAFITGSHAYGTPRPDSDIDVVVLVDGVTEYMIHKMSDVYDSKKQTPCVFGKLNLIFCTDPISFTCWHMATMQMSNDQKRANVSYDKHEATEIIDSYFAQAGLPRLTDPQSGG